MSNAKSAIRDFVFRGILFESEAEYFNKAGISVGSDRSTTESELMYQALAPFGIKRRNDGLEMARLYAVLHCFENELREFIKEAMDEQVGTDWWANPSAVPGGVKSNAESRQKTALKDSWLEGEKADFLGFVDFGDLAKIIVHNWPVFSDVIPSQEWLKQRMFELEKARNFIAHNRMLLPSEFQRMYMYVSDWNKLIGL